MRCAKCEDRQLVRESVGFFCPTCGGRWFREGTWTDAAPEIDRQTRVETHDQRAGRCPEGHGFMQRARVADERFFLERCSACRGIWFDRGEWTQLAEQAALSALEDLWDRNKQQARRAARVRSRIDDDLREELGEPTFDALSKLVATLRHHPARSQALAWLRARLELDEGS